MESTEAALRINAMWERIGRALERRAYELAKSESSLDRNTAISAAMAAEGCFWRATGEEDCATLKVPSQ